MSDASSSALILTAVSEAERLRRRRAATRLLARVVPAVAGGWLVAAVVVRFLQAPLAVFWILAVLAGLGVSVFAWLARRVPAVTDAAAARIDTDAALGGELQSAHWFASHPNSDVWTAYHLDGAAARVRAVSWPTIYPPVQATRAWAGSTVLGVAAVALALTSGWPRFGGFAIGGGSGASASAASAGQAFPADLQKRIDAMLRDVANGALAADAARERVSDLREALSNLDPKLQDALAKAAAEAQKPGSAGRKMADPELETLAARAEDAAADAALPEDVKWSLQDLAGKLAAAGKQPADGAKRMNADTKDSQAGGAQAASAAQAAGAEMTRTTAADAQSNQMMASAAGPMGGSPQGRGGGAGRKGGENQPLDLSGALRKESVEASDDSAGANVLAEMRRKSEQSRSTLAFSHVAPLAAYDKSHASAPPPPPDSLRPLVQQYFIRR